MSDDKPQQTPPNTGGDGKVIKSYTPPPPPVQPTVKPQPESSPKPAPLKKEGNNG